MNTAGVPVYTVSQVNGYVKDLMDDDPLLAGLLVRGEVSNYKCYPSGHHYFSLKDENASLRCVMFRGEAARLRFRPANGMRVVVFGRVSAFPRDGQYQLYCAELMQDGRGALDEAFEKLRRRLEGITQSTLTKQLRELEQDGFLHREIYREIPPRVEYRLTELGESFIPVLYQMLSWSEERLCPPDYVNPYGDQAPEP